MKKSYISYFILRTSYFILHALEKIKTIGDAYMVVGGLPVQRSNHAEAIAAMVLDMITRIIEFCQEMGQSLRIRIGINTGSVVAGIVGTKKFIYDLWGDFGVIYLLPTLQSCQQDIN
jgi:class 3 adenylate cyclase